MAIGKTNAGAGGSGGVNFRVVNGLTQPTSPKENTIWVKTDIEIPYWTTASSNKAPAYVAPAGTVTFWWESATSGEVSGTTAAGFMPIKFKATNPPGNMRLKPINCYQNQDGTAAGWKSMDAYIYKGGTWVQFSESWNGEIYDAGTSFFPFVKTDTSNFGGYTNNANAGTNKGSVTFGTSDITLYCYEQSGGNNSAQFFGSSDKIDLSDYSTLKVTFSNLSVSESETKNYVCVSASPDKVFPGDGDGAAYAKKYSSSGAQTISIDISNLNEAYIVVTGRLYSSSKTINATITKIWLE